MGGWGNSFLGGGKLRQLRYRNIELHLIFGEFFFFFWRPAVQGLQHTLLMCGVGEPH